MSASRANRDEPTQSAGSGGDCIPGEHVHVTLPMCAGRTHVPLVVYVQAGVTPGGVTTDISMLVRLQKAALTEGFTEEDATTELLTLLRDAVSKRLEEMRKAGS